MNLKSMTQPEIGAVLKELGQPAFRAKQVYSWLHKGVTSFDEMSNLSKDLRNRLNEMATLCPLEIVDCLISEIDGTRKYLFRLEDGSIIVLHDSGGAKGAPEHTIGSLELWIPELLKKGYHFVTISQGLKGERV